jgi:hypothetical protein
MLLSFVIRESRKEWGEKRDMNLLFWLRLKMILLLYESLCLVQYRDDGPIVCEIHEMTDTCIFYDHITLKRADCQRRK